jgi:hypothetical protein
MWNRLEITEILQKPVNCQFFLVEELYRMTSKGSGEIFEGDSADMCAGKFLLVSMESERRVLRVQGACRNFW